MRAELDQSPIVGKELGTIYTPGQHLEQLMGDYRRGWRLFKDRLGLASYRDLPRCKFENSEHFLRVQIAAWGGTSLLRDDP
jgi:hypothetical protein